jgi:hypothetical protein
MTTYHRPHHLARACGERGYYLVHDCRRTYLVSVVNCHGVNVDECAPIATGNIPHDVVVSDKCCWQPATDLSEVGG